MATADQPIRAKPTLRTVIVDDSALARLMLRDALSGIEGVRVVGNAAEGAAALEVIQAVNPDLIILDVEMPGMNGLELLREMKERRLSTPVLMCSRLTSEGAEVTTEALLQGAYDFVAKPSGNSRGENVEQLRREIGERVAPLVNGKTGPNRQEPTQRTRAVDRKRASLDQAEIDVVLIGSSTGGPVALRKLLGNLSHEIAIPIIVVQHIPEGFSAALARRLDELCPLPVMEAGDGTAVTGGRVYFAPGGRHLSIVGSAAARQFRLDDSPLVHGCRPAIDVTLESIREHFGGRAAVVILTGMGRDGAAGAKAIRDQGGVVMAQSPKTSTVSSMPRQTINLAGADRVADLAELSQMINRLAARS